MPPLVLTKKPKNAIVISGFPGFGLVGTIATGFLIDHLKCEKIGTHWFEDLPATIAIHEHAIVDPVGVYYNKKYNVIIVHSIANVQGVEWDAAQVVLDICKQTNAKELIAIEGVNSQQMDQQRGFFYSREKSVDEKMKKAGITELTEGIIVGVAGALLLKASLPMTCVFAETHTQLPDSAGAAKAIEILDKYLNLDVDYKPLLKQAAMFEEKIKELMEKSAKAHEAVEKKQLNYVG